MNQCILISVTKLSLGETKEVELGKKHPLIVRIGANDIDELIYYLEFELGDNNWSCDCNRCLFFGDEPSVECREAEYAVNWFEVDGRRFLSTNKYGTEFRENKT
jgi:hypothetical protein